MIKNQKKYYTFLQEMDYDAEYFEKMLREEERNKRQHLDNQRSKKRHPSRERSRGQRRQKRTQRSPDRNQPSRRDREDPKRNDRRNDRDNERQNYRGGYRGNDRGNDRRDRRDVQRDPYYRDRRQIQKVRQTDSKKADQMEQELEKRIILDKKTKEVEAMTEKFKEAQRQFQEAKREDLTVLVYCLPLKAKENDIWNFFKTQLCGKVRDIRIIKDPKSSRSKGVAYVQFYTSESVQKALRTDGRQFQFGGRKSALKVQHSQAQKNRAAAVSKNMRIHKQVQTVEQSNETMRKQTKVVIGGLVGRLADIQERQLKDPFQAFGHIQKIDINRDPMTGRCKGFAFIQYSQVEHARNAVKAMNGQPLKGQTLSVSIVNVSQQNQQIDSSSYFENQNYNRPRPTGNNLRRPPMATLTTNMIVIYDMFTMQGKIPAFFEGLKKQFFEKCSSYGTVQNIFIERNDQGNIWVKFAEVQSARKAIEGLQKIFFDGNRVKCYSVTETTYNSRVNT